MHTTNSEENDNLLPASEIISALHTILRSRAMMPDLETPYSQTTFPHPSHCAIELDDQSINAIITDRRQQLDATLRDIWSLESVVDKINNLHRQLTEQKDKLISSITLHKRFISPLWRLPTEVLSHIFIHCLPEDKYPSPALMRAPILLTRICRRWREVAVGTPSLWCRLNVICGFRRWQGCLDVWLKRSRGHPLSLALICSHKSTVSELRDILQPYINQISSFSLHCGVFSDRYGLLLKDLTALQELVVVRPLTEQVFSRLPPTLRSFKLTMSFFELELWPSGEPVWANLTNVEIPLHCSTTLFHLLQLCPNLCSLVIRLLFSETEIFEPLVHIQIQSLHIVDSIPDHLPGLFNALSLPSLHTLEVHGVSWPHQEFKSFLTRSKCPLETVILGAKMKTECEQQAECVALIPSLEVVVVSI
ncbi:uncharacterized protein EDB93DRAFT_1154734 [Suillus bovinus]|uniref:uncharacterized protein n=1 Tax=Suillus bovinus TaxID=48563 RepID=UPI001B85D8CA|nr:uncharacterized protein EDB93DRAFT_1154734 [Suillus bovinus]KAG2143781.1 hypothetical protein EDB93DRAFT_1154734 [Suillus bovinus]